jgi:hypothetical protein
MCRSIACCRSPSYQVSGKKSLQQQDADRKSKKQQIQQQHGNHSTSPPQQPHSGVILEASTVVATVQQQLRGSNGGAGVQAESVATPSAVTFERKPTKDGLSKVRNIATSSISGEEKASLLNNKHILKYGLLSFMYIVGVKCTVYNTNLMTQRRFVHKVCITKICFNKYDTFL